MEDFGISEEAPNLKIPGEENIDLEAPSLKIPAEETINLEKEKWIIPIDVNEADEAVNSPAQNSQKYFQGRFSDVSSRSFPALSSSSRRTNSSDITAESKPHNTNSAQWEVLKEIAGRDKELEPRHFVLVRAIGDASFGDVFLTRLADTSTYFATKVMNRNDLESQDKLKCLYNELEILQMLDHPFLPTLYHYFAVDNLSALVMEYCPGGDLFTLRQKKPDKLFSEKDTRFYASEVLSAMEYLHMMGVVYRDLKPESILIKEDGHIMLTDFASSYLCDMIPTKLEVVKQDKAPQGHQSTSVRSRLQLPLKFHKKKNKLRKDKQAPYLNTSIPELIQGEPATSARSMSIVGTYEYLAPEMIEGKGYGSSVDWWAFGIFIYELLFGKTPFREPDDFDKPVNFPESVLVSSAAKDLIKRLLTKDPKLRLGYNGGASEIKLHAFFHGINWALLCYSSNRPPLIPGPYHGQDDDSFEDDNPQ